MYRPPLPPGHALKQNYLIVRLVAEGGASLVYLASRTGNRWIIKEHFDGNFTQRASDAVSIVSKTGQEHIVARIHKRLQEEVARARVLHHHGMVEMLDAFSENGTVYTVMPYYEGATLEALPDPHHLPNLILLLQPVFDDLTY